MRRYCPGKKYSGKNRTGQFPGYVDFKLWFAGSEREKGNATSNTSQGNRKGDTQKLECLSDVGGKKGET